MHDLIIILLRAIGILGMIFYVYLIIWHKGYLEHFFGDNSDDYLNRGKMPPRAIAVMLLILFGICGYFVVIHQLIKSMFNIDISSDEDDSFSPELIIFCVFIWVIYSARKPDGIIGKRLLNKSEKNIILLINQAVDEISSIDYFAKRNQIPSFDFDKLKKELRELFVNNANQTKQTSVKMDVQLHHVYAAIANVAKHQLMYGNHYIYRGALHGDGNNYLTLFNQSIDKLVGMQVIDIETAKKHKEEIREIVSNAG